MPQRSSWGSNEPARRKGYRRLRFWADMHDGRGYRRCSETVRGSKRDGDRRLAELMVLHSEDAPCPTVGQAYDLWWLPDAEARVEEYERRGAGGKRGETLKPRSLAQMESAWNAHVAPRWADVPACDVRPLDLQAWLSTKTEQTAQRCLTLLRQILRFCQLQGCVPGNVAAMDYRMPSKSARYDGGIWPLRTLLDEIWPRVWGGPAEVAFIMSAFGSCRGGEAVSPRLDEVRAVEAHGMAVAVVPIVRQVSDRGAVSGDGDLKNRWSVRTVLLPEPFSLRVLQICDEKRAHGLSWLADDGTGAPVPQCRARKAYYAALDAAGLKRLQMRALRRSWRSWAATSGIPAELLEKMMGHVGDGTTGRHYLRLDDVERLADEVARAFSERPVEMSWDPLEGPATRGR